MDCTSLLPGQTGYFSKIVLDYLDQHAALSPFYAYPPTIEGIKEAIEKRKTFATDRELLVTQLKKQYQGVNASAATMANIDALASADTFTVTTAHQNNIFTGPLYFIYKIIHAIRLADSCKTLYDGYNFVPVFYIGSEDADLDELNHVQLGKEKLTWNTSQKGAVGRMKIDKELIRLIERMEGELAIHPGGDGFIALLREHYREGVMLQDATFGFVNALFSGYGLVILLPDNASLKASMLAVFKDELLHQPAAGLIEETAGRLSDAGYKVQAHPREINLFYLEDGSRERIEKKGDMYQVVNSSRTFTQAALLEELNTHPERFSPNVILRGLYQATILPDIAFIGGGGELAYWLQLQGLFNHYQTPFPVLILRNSFLILEKKWKERVDKLGLSLTDLFLPAQELLSRVVARDSSNETTLNGSLQQVEELYTGFKKQASAIDPTLEKHVDALRQKTVYRLQELEKKMLRAEKRKFTDQQQAIGKIKEHLFPRGGLQERVDNIGYYYSVYGGASFIDELYRYSKGLEQEFCILMPAS